MSTALFQHQLETRRHAFADKKHERLLLNRIRRHIIHRCEETSLARPVVPKHSAALLDAKQDTWLKDLEDEAAEEHSGDGVTGGLSKKEGGDIDEEMEEDDEEMSSEAEDAYKEVMGVENALEVVNVEDEDKYR
ncbi:hypothetical protein RUND412_009877 [Rhizina undulata]